VHCSLSSAPCNRWLSSLPHPNTYKPTCTAWYGDYADCVCCTTTGTIMLN
jgi:hypothetical protein